MSHAESVSGPDFRARLTMHPSFTDAPDSQWIVGYCDCRPALGSAEPGVMIFECPFCGEAAVWVRGQPECEHAAEIEAAVVAGYRPSDERSGKTERARSGRGHKDPGPIWPEDN